MSLWPNGWLFVFHMQTACYASSSQSIVILHKCQMELIITYLICNWSCSCIDYRELLDSYVSMWVGTGIVFDTMGLIVALWLCCFGCRYPRIIQNEIHNVYKNTHSSSKQKRRKTKGNNHFFFYILNNWARTKKWLPSLSFSAFVIVLTIPLKTLFHT